MSKVITLTPEQKSILLGLYDRWVELDKSCVPTSPETVEAAINRMYTAIHKQRPAFIHVASPLAATLKVAEIRATAIGSSRFTAPLASDFEHQLKRSLMSRLQALVKYQFGGAHWSQIRTTLEMHIQICDNVDDLYFGSTACFIDEAISQEISTVFPNFYAESTEEQLSCPNIYSQLEFMWPEIYGLCINAGLIYPNELLETLQLWLDQSRDCYWWWPMEGVCVTSQRPAKISTDDQGQLHCESGPSIVYQDGWSTYHWHGTTIPSEWITKQKPSAQEALACENIEQRRAACEIVGWNRILSELNARVIDANGNEEIGTLLEVDLPDAGPERFLQVRCGTGRQFALPVPRMCETAIQANAWTYDLTENDFKPEVRT